MLLPQTLLQDRYRIERSIGAGGMGAVYAAHDLRLNNRIAVKQILRGDPVAFEQEAQLLARLRHPGLPRVIDHFVEDAGQFLVMEYISGHDLAAQIQRGPSFRLEQLLQWGDQLLDVLIYLHRQQPPIIHRDIKPANLKMADDGSLILLDFGLAKGSVYPDAVRSLPGYTLSYAAPEQIHGEGTDARSDLYSAGATLYHLATRVLPVDAVQRERARMRGYADPLQPADEHTPIIPPALAEILRRALALQPEDRFNNAEAMQKALRTIRTSGETVYGVGEQTILPERSTSTALPLSIPNNLPVQLTSLVGRVRENEALVTLLTRDTVRLVTLTGPGGVGKTRLALHTARNLLAHFPDGVYFVSLASIRMPDRVIDVIAQTLAVREAAGRTLLEGVQEHLGSRRLLLLLDNFEQVIDAATVVTDLLRTCAELKIIVTSRELLQLSGEHTFDVPPLGVPDHSQPQTSAEIGATDAVHLFVQRAQAAQSDFALTESNAPIVAEICLRLDGLPLAIELAAARVRELSPQDILARLADRFRLLSRGPRDVPERQRTLRAAIEWSYDLLSSEEQTLFRRIAVFIGGRTLAATEAICSLSNDANGAPRQLDTLDGLTSLVDKSLLMAVAQSDGEIRYTMLVTIHDFANSLLMSSVEADAICDRHAVWFLALAEQAEPHLRGQDQVRWFQQLETEHDNLRAALTWFAAQDQPAQSLRLCGALWRFWWIRCYFREALDWLTQALARAEHLDPSLKIGALVGAGTMTRDLGRYADALAFFEQLLTIQHGLADQRGIAAALNNLGTVGLYEGDYLRAASYFEESLTMRRELSDKLGMAGALNNLGTVYLQQEDYVRAQRVYEECLPLYREVGDVWGAGLALSNLAFTQFMQGDLISARETFLESLHIYIDLEDKEGICTNIEALAWIAGAEDKMLYAAQLAGAAAKLLQEVGTTLYGADKIQHEQNMNAMLAALGETAFHHAWHTGQTLSTKKVIALALSPNP